MIILFILGLLLGAAAVVFTLQNVAIITITFFSWQLTGSLAMILALAITCGLVIAFLLLLPQSVGNYYRYKNLQNENKKLAEDLRKQKELTVFAKSTPPTPEIISQIEHGAVADI